MPIFAISAVSATFTADDTFSIHRMFPFLAENLMHSSVAVPLMTPGPEVIKLFLCSTQLSMKFQMLISIKISRNSAFVRLR